MSFQFQSIGTALPAQAISQRAAAEVAQILCSRNADEAALLASLHRQSGVDCRHMVFTDEVLADVRNRTDHSGSAFLPSRCTGERGPGTAVRMQQYRQDAWPLAIAASNRALHTAGRYPADVTHLITVSCTGFVAPGLGAGLTEALELVRTVQMIHVGFMGCHGAINGLRVAEAFIEGNPRACVLLCCVELCSIHYQYGWDPKKAVANALFADGAAALVGTAVPSPKSASSWVLRATGSFLFPNSALAMTWTIGDNGFTMTLSTRVPALIAAHLPGWLDGWLGEHGLCRRDIRTWAVHPGGPRILSAVEDCLDLHSEDLAESRKVLAECGNMSSPTILFVLERLRRQDAPRPCVALAFGPGLTVEAALIS